MIKLDPFLAIGDDTVLIISHPTGVEYEVQAGGMACNHPSCEGFALNLGSFMADFDDCSYGCEYIQLNYEMKARLAAALDEQMKAETAGWQYQISIDDSRIDELMEGWWPVLVKGKFDGVDIDWNGYIHTGNCD